MDVGAARNQFCRRRPWAMKDGAAGTTATRGQLHCKWPNSSRARAAYE